MILVQKEDYEGRSGFEQLFEKPNKLCIWWDLDARIEWDDNPFTWDELCIALELKGGGSSQQALQTYQSWEKEKKRKFIVLYCKIKDQERENYRDCPTLSKEKIDIHNVGVREIELVVEALLFPNLKATILED